MFSFSETNIDPVLLEKSACIADLFVADTYTARDLLIDLLSSAPSDRTLETLSALSASLFLCIGSAEPDDTAAMIADKFAEVVNSLWENPVGGPQHAAVSFTALLIASDFSPENPAVVSEIDSVGPARIVVALAQWVLALSTTIAVVQDSAPRGGDPIRWASPDALDAPQVHRVAVVRGGR